MEIQPQSCSNTVLRGEFTVMNTYIDTKRKILNKQPIFTRQGTRKRQTKFTFNRRKEITRSGQNK